MSNSKPKDLETFEWALWLTPEIYGRDSPIWEGGPYMGISKKDGHYSLGSNLIVWFPAKNGSIYPGIVNPIDTDCKMTTYETIVFANRSSVSFVKGRTMDLLVRKLEGSNTSFDRLEVFPIRDGLVQSRLLLDLYGISKGYSFSKDNMLLFQDRYLMTHAGNQILVFSLETGAVFKQIDGIPIDGILVHVDSRLVIWSKKESKRLVLDLENVLSDTELQTSKSLVLLSQPVPADMFVYGASLDFMVVGIGSEIRVYNSAGSVVYERTSKERVEFISMIDSFESNAVAFVVNVLNSRIVVYYADGKFIEQEIGFIEPRSMLLYEDKVYVFPANDALTMYEIKRLTSNEQYKKTVQRTKTVKPIDIYVRISPVFGWILECVNDFDGTFRLVIRTVFNRPIKIHSNTKYVWKDFDDEDCLVTPFIYITTKETIHLWVPTVIRDDKLNGKKYLLLNLHEWNETENTIGKVLRTLPKIQLFPKKDPTPDVSRWFKTEEWVILVLGRKAYVFKHEGNQVITEIELAANEPIHIKSVKGFRSSLWFLGGQSQQRILENGKTGFVDHIKEVVYWDGISTTARTLLKQGCDMMEAVASGIEIKRGGNQLKGADLVIAVPNGNGVWRHLTFAGGVIFDNDFMIADGYKGDRCYLCPQVDSFGKIFYAVGNKIHKIDFEEQKDYLKVDLTGIEPTNKKKLLPIKIDKEYVTAMSLGPKYLWVTTCSSFYCLMIESIFDYKIPQFGLPLVPVPRNDQQSVVTVIQSPLVIRTIMAKYAKMDTEAIFQNDQFVWISNKPYRLYKNTDLLKPGIHKNIIVSETGRLLILDTQTQKISQQEKEDQVTLRSSLCEVLL